MTDTDELYNACYSGDTEKVITMLGRGEVDVNAISLGFSPLMLAVIMNHPHTVKALLSWPGTRLGVANDAGKTALHYACMNNRSAFIQILAKDPRCTPEVLNRKENFGATALLCAVNLNNLEAVKELEKFEGVNFRTKNKWGETVVDVARLNGDTDMLGHLLQRSQRVESLSEIAAYNLARHLHTAEDSQQLELPNSLQTLVTKYLDR